MRELFDRTGAPAEAAALVAAELADAGVALGAPGVEALIQAAREVRLQGRLPYYTVRAIAHWFAGQPAPAEGSVRAALGQRYGVVREVELTQDVAEAYADAQNGRPFARPTAQVALIKQGYESGYYSEKTYRGCAQCTLDALFKTIGLRDEALFRSSDMLASGCGLFGDGPCGGYSGGLLFLGKYAGRRLEFIDGDKEEKARGRRLAALLHQRFIDTYGTVICHEIHKDIFGRAFDLHDDLQKQGFEEAGAHRRDKCTAVVATATRWVIEILLDEGYITA